MNLLLENIIPNSKYHRNTIKPSLSVICMILAIYVNKFPSVEGRKNIVSIPINSLNFFTAEVCYDKDAILAATNNVRNTYHSNPLIWNNTLAEASMNWATWLAENNCKLFHGSYGENLAVNQFSPYSVQAKNSPTCVSSVARWASEVLWYDFSSTPWTSNKDNFNSIGHFTQLVWNDTTSMGCAIGQGYVMGSRRWTCQVIVCRYFPYGNYESDILFLKNIRPK